MTLVSKRLLVAVLLALPAIATRALAADGTVALSAAERAAVLDAAAATKDDSLDTGRSRAIHGKMEIAFGSRGYRALYGTTVIPLGDTATAVVSVATVQGGRRGR